MCLVHSKQLFLPLYPSTSNTPGVSADSSNQYVEIQGFPADAARSMHRGTRS